MRRSAIIAYNISYKHIGIFHKPFVALCDRSLVMHFIKLFRILHLIIVILIRFHIRKRIRYNKYQRTIMLVKLSLCAFDYRGDKNIEFAVTPDVKLDILFCGHQFSNDGINLLFYKEKIVNLSMSYK